MIRLETVNPDNWRLRLKVSDAQKSFVADSATMLARAYAYRESRSKARMSFITIPFLWERHYIMTVQSLTHMT